MRTIKLWYEIIWIDEFTWSYRGNHIYRWCKSKEKRYVSLKDSQFKISFIFAFSQSRFYGLIGSENTNHSIIFVNFQLQLWESFKDVECFDADRWILLMDNASIYKSEYIQKIAMHRKIRIITIACMRHRSIQQKS